MQSTDIILSILPLEYVVKQAKEVVKAMKAMNVYLDYVDCNAISPSTTKEVTALSDRLAANFVDGGIVGLSPLKDAGLKRLYISGADTAVLRLLNGQGLVVLDLGPKIGRASTLKIVYASSTKGAF